MEKNEAASVPTAFLVDLVSNRKIPITTPRCRVGRDDLNDIVISGDQSISRFHFIITYENGQYQTQDAKSRHGTFLNGNQIGGPEPINDGDVLKIGVSLFWFVIESQAGIDKDEPLPPVDVEKAAGAEEVSLKKGGDYSYSGEVELSATQEISIISPEQLAQYSLTKQADENEFEAKETVEPVEAEKATSKAESDSAPEKSDDEKKEDDAKSSDESAKNGSQSKDAEPEVVEAKEPDSKDAESTSSDSPESATKTETAEQSTPESSDDKKESEEKKDSKSDSAEADEKPAEPTGDADSSSEAKISKEEEVSIAVKDLLEPLQDEIAASREMIRDALKKGEMSFDTDATKLDDDKKEPEQAASDEDKTESIKKDDEESPESKESSSDGTEKETAEPSSKSDSDSEEVKTEPQSTSEQDSEEPESTAKKDDSEDVKSEEAETLERIAEIIDDTSAKSDLAEKSEDESPGVSADRIETTLASDHDRATNGYSEDIETIMGPSTVPDWCKRYFSDELKHLNKELDTLNDQIKQYQDKIRKIEGQAAQTKGIRNTLLTAEGDDLIEACKQVLGLAGWKVTQSEEDKHEFLLEHEDEKVAIARVISIKGSAERSHLGQLSISQTRFWCEKGIEPKGVLIVGRVSDKSPKDRGEETNPEVTEYANMKNVCIMDTLQLLALYRDIALKDGKSSELRSSIHLSKGWLKGFDLEPGDEAADDDDKESSKSKSLSSLLSA
ncbi:MAG: FHA domain-containing protein [Candidatus Melainabacteria bacterium]|nr:FHA domain-containing protein [Candidatus Melainabacteria bacterium]